MRKLTIVVGAGASTDYNLPIGSELKPMITECFEWQSSRRRQSDAATNVSMALTRLAAGQPDGLRQYENAAKAIRNGLPLAASIDNLLDAHGENAVVGECGKVAIAQCIADAERRSTLYDLDDRGFSRLPNPVPHGWLSELFQVIVGSCKPSELEARLSSLTFVIFNYDRCVEHFLYGALPRYYSGVIDADKAADLLENVRFHHPYGSIGALPWQIGSIQVSFGAQLDPNYLIESAKSLRTFSEGTDDSTSEIEAIRASVADADVALFVGFAYHRINMKLLAGSMKAGASPAKRLTIGTAMGVSKEDLHVIQQELQTIRGTTEGFSLEQDESSATIFRRFARALEFSTEKSKSRKKPLKP